MDPGPPGFQPGVPCQGTMHVPTNGLTECCLGRMDRLFLGRNHLGKSPPIHVGFSRGFVPPKCQVLELQQFAQNDWTQLGGDVSKSHPKKGGDLKFIETGRVLSIELRCDLHGCEVQASSFWWQMLEAWSREFWDVLWSEVSKVELPWFIGRACYIDMCCIHVHNIYTYIYTYNCIMYILYNAYIYTYIYICTYNIWYIYIIHMSMYICIYIYAHLCMYIHRLYKY